MQDPLLTETVTFLVAFSGTLSNLLVLLSARNMLSMNSSFGLITKNQAVCNILMCLTFLFYILPMQVVREPFFLEYSHFVGVFLMTLYEVSVASHLFIALNRLCTVFWPARYDSFFSYHLTEHIRNGIWLLSIITCTILYELLGCHFTLNPSSLSMEFLPTCTDLTWYSDFILNTSLVAITLLINLITLYKAGKNRKLRNVSVGIKLSIGQQKRKLNFLKQTFSQGTAIFTGQVAYYLIVPMVQNNVFEFFFVTLWAYIHSLEGFIILTTNPDIRRYVFQNTSKKVRQVLSSVKHFRGQAMENEQILGVFTVISAIFGCVTNWSVVLFFHKIPVLRSSFGFLSAHGALITAAYCTIALFWISPMMLLDAPFLEKYSYYPGFLLYLLYDLATETHFLICLNRFCAVVLPHRYNSWFSFKSTATLIALLWTFCTLISLLVFPLSNCQMFYDTSITTLTYTNTPECQELTFIADFGLHMLVVIVMIILNSITFYQFRRKNREMLSTINHASSVRKSQSEKNFLRQTFYQETFYTVALITYFLIGPLLEQEWLRFLVILLPWYFVHAFEAMVTIMCNPELKKLCFRKWKLCFATPESPVTEAWRSTTTHVVKI